MPDRYLDSILENIPIVLFIKDAKDLRYLRVNKACEELVGQSREGIIGKNDHDFFPKSEADFFSAKDREVLAGGKLVDIPEEPIHTKRGVRILHTRKVPIFDEHGKPVFLLGIAEDITERKRGDKERDARSAMLSTQQEISLDGILVVDEQGRIISYNRRFVEIWDIPADVVESRSDERALASVLDRLKEPERFLARVRELYANKDEKSQEEIELKDGRVFDRYSAPMRGPDGRHFGRVWYFRDITDRKQKESEIRSLNRELQERVEALKSANEELDAFAWSASHDLRAPLRNVSGFVELLQRRSDETFDAEGRRYLEVIASSTERMAKLIDDVLEFSTSGRDEIRWVRVDLKALIEDVRKEAGADASRADWKIGELPEVKADPAMLRQVFANLIGNALKFTRDRKPARIEIGWSAGPKESVFFVRDNGAGFDMRYAEKLFAMFERLHRRSEFEGSGLGLANVRRLIRRHGGRTWAEGKVGEGATFYFSLPSDG